MLTLSDFKLGRMAFPTLEGDFKEAVGDALEVVGAGLVAGERKPRSLNLIIPVRASSAELNPYADGDRMRRQVRSLMENSAARLSGLYIKVAFDPEQNGWMLIGGADLEYGEGGLAFADYKLSLADAYIVGQRRTVRPARRITVFDRRLSTTPRDYEKLFYGTDFSPGSGLAALTLPSGVSDIRSSSPGTTKVGNSFATSDGGVLWPIKGTANGDVLHFEQAEAEMGLGDVLILDRRGNKGPATLMENKEPQANYGWEEVYGQNYPLTTGDIPVLSNGLCRVRLLESPKWCFVVDQFSGGAWVERCRIAPATGAAEPEFFGKELIYATVKEWTPEKAVIFARIRDEKSNENRSFDVYITLTRGMTAPRVEVYTRPGAYGTTPRAYLMYMPAANFTTAFVNSANLKLSSDAWTGVTITWSASDEPWGTLLPLGGSLAPRISFAQFFARPVKLTESTALYGTARKGFWIEGTSPNAVNTGYVGVRFGIGALNGLQLEAEAIRNAGSVTTSQVALGEGSGGQVVQETQAADTNATLSAAEPGNGFPSGEESATMRIWVKLRVVTAGATASVRAKYVGSTTEIKTTTATALTWVDLGALTRGQVGSLEIRAWRSAGAGNVYVDQILVVPYSNQYYDGAGDLGQASLYETSAYSELVAR